MEIISTKNPSNIPIIFSIVAQVTNTVAEHDCFSAVSSEHVPHTPFRTHRSAHTVSHYISDITIQGGALRAPPCMVGSFG